MVAGSKQSRAGKQSRNQTLFSHMGIFTMFFFSYGHRWLLHLLASVYVPVMKGGQTKHACERSLPPLPGKQQLSSKPHSIDSHWNLSGQNQDTQPPKTAEVLEELHVCNCTLPPLITLGSISRAEEETSYDVGNQCCLPHHSSKLDEELQFLHSPPCYISALLDVSFSES